VTRRLLAALVATLLGLATGAVVVSAPAQAAACVRGQGVTVVVDPQQLGGGTTTTCVAGGGRAATEAFAAAGVSMRRVTSQPGFVCQVQGLPGNAGCSRTPPATAYWSLWVSTGDGTWSYATTGVDGLSVPKGGWVAWSWQGQEGRAQPGVGPVGVAAPRPSSGASQGAGGKRGESSSSPRPSADARGGSASGSTSDGATKGDAGRKDAKDEDEKREDGKREDGKREDGDGEAATAAPTTDAPADGDARSASADAGSGSPVGTLAAVVVVLALLAAAGVVAWRRRSAAP
jgi:hypothetical protein